MTRFKKYFSQITSIKKKVIIGCSIAAIVLVSGLGVYAMNTTGKEDISSVKTVENDATTEEKQNQDADSVQKPKVDKNKTVQQEKVTENKPNDTVNINTQSNTENTQNQPVQSKPTEQVKPKSNESTTKKENVQQKQAANKPITYTSKGLGISFDMPGDWANKYVVKDNGESIHVFMKNSGVNDGRGLLFTITSNITDYNNGSMLDSVPGVDKTMVIKGRKYLLGAPTGCVVEVGDPDEGLYKNMSHQISQVLKSLR